MFSLLQIKLGNRNMTLSTVDKVEYDWAQPAGAKRTHWESTRSGTGQTQNSTRLH